MTGDTHRKGGVLVALSGYILLQQKGMLLPNVNEFLQLAVLYPFCYWGSTMSDLDHNPDSCPSRDIFSKVINRGLHLTEGIEKRVEPNSLIGKLSRLLNAHHRSWQTHSDFTVVMTLLLWYVATHNLLNLDETSGAIFTLISIGLCLGIWMHLFLDMLTPEGIHLIGFSFINKVFHLTKAKLKLPTKLRLVPKQKFFATGGKWESIVNWGLAFLTVLLLLYVLFSHIYGGLL